MGEKPLLAALALLAVISCSVGVQITLPVCKSAGQCSNEICSYTLNFTAALGNASVTDLIPPGEYSGSGKNESCSLFQRLSVCVDKNQAFKPEYLPGSFRTSSGAKCKLQDVHILQSIDDDHVMYARNGFVPACLLSRSGCDCGSTLYTVDWTSYTLASIAKPDGSARKFPPRISCKKGGNKHAYAVFALSCPLQAGEWVAADIALARTYTTDYCAPSNLNDGVYVVFVALLMLGCLMFLGFILLLIQAAAHHTIHFSVADTAARRWALNVSSVLGTLFDMNGVLVMDMAEGRDRFFTVNVMTSAVLTIGIIVFAPKLVPDEEVAFGMPNAQLSNLDLKRIVALATQNPNARVFLKSLLIPLLTLGISACLGLLAYLILLVNYTAPPPWTRKGDASKLVANERVHKGWRAKYIWKKFISLLALVMFDVVFIVMAGQQYAQYKRWMYPIPNIWLYTVSITITFTMHLKFVEVVFLELTDGGAFSGCFCCCLCIRSIRQRYEETPWSQYNIPVAKPVQSMKTDVQSSQNFELSYTVNAEQLATADSVTDTSVVKDRISKPKKLVREESENASTSLARNFSVRVMRDRFKTMWADTPSKKQFKYSGWILGAVTISVVLAVFFYATNMNRVLVFKNCLDLQDTCELAGDKPWVPMILTGVSAILSRGDEESVLTKMVSTFLSNKIDTTLGNMDADAFKALQFNGSTGTDASEIYQVIQTCDPEEIDTLINTVSSVVTADVVANSNVTAIQAVAALGFDITTIVKPIIESQLYPAIGLACPITSTVAQNVTEVESKIYKKIDSVDRFLRSLQHSFYVGGMVGCSIGLVVALVSLLVIMQVYRSAILRLKKEQAMRGLLQSNMDTEEKEEAVQMFMLTEEARETLPLRAVFFYGVIFSSVLLQMQIVSGVFTLILMLLLMPWFWSTIAIQIAAYVVTIVVGVLISIIVVGTLGRNLAPNGRINSPSGWLVYYIIFSCAYIVLGIFIAVSRLVFVILTSLVYIVRIDKCINLVGKHLDPAYTSFLGMIRMHYELRDSENRNKRYTGNWGRVRRLVFERKHLLKQELERRGVEQNVTDATADV